MAKDLMDSMTFDAKEVVNCRKQIEVTIPADVVAAEAEKAAKAFASYVNIPGFRKGKAPVGMLKSRYADDIKQELERRLVSAAYQKVANPEEDILSCGLEGSPKVEFNQEFKFTFNVDLAPEIDLGEYKGLEVAVETKEVSDDDVAERLNMYRTMYANYADVTEEAKAEDMLKVSYTSDFAVSENASAYLKRQVEAADNFLWLKEPEMIPGSVAALTGAKAGDVKEFAAVYPEDYREAELAGKTVNYKLTVNAVQRRQELSDEELVKKLNAPSIDDFKATLKASMERELADANNAKLLDAVADKLDETVKEFELPAAFLEGETNRELNKLAGAQVKSEADAEEFKKNLDEHKKTAEENAKKSLRRSLILRKIARLEKITVTGEEMDQQIAVMSSYYGYKPKELRANLEKSGNIEELHFNMLSAKVLQFVADNIKK